MRYKLIPKPLMAPGCCFFSGSSVEEVYVDMDISTFSSRKGRIYMGKRVLEECARLLGMEYPEPKVEVKPQIVFSPSYEEVSNVVSSALSKLYHPSNGRVLHSDNAERANVSPLAEQLPFEQSDVEGLADVRPTRNSSKPLDF